jgi:hypothetical protein
VIKAARFVATSTAVVAIGFGATGVTGADRAVAVCRETREDRNVLLDAAGL